MASRSVRSTVSIAHHGGERTLSGPEFQEFLRILSGNDAEALEQLLEWLEPWLRAIIRSRLAGQRLGSGAGVSDILQSLLKDFVGRANRQAEKPLRTIQTERYLMAAVERKIRAKFRKERRHAGSLSEWPDPRASATVDKNVEGDDFVASVRRRLDPRSQELFDLRMHGLSWPELSGMIGETPDALRMRLRRSVATAICGLNRKELTGG
jgi:DNA-directed RNA polymerase specialized sigma24 family protein